MKNRKELFYESIAKEFHTKKDRLNYFLDLKYDSPYQSLLEIKADVKKYMNNGIPDSLHGKLSSIFFDLDEPYDDTLTAGRDVYDYIEKILEKAPSNTQFGPEGNYRESLIRSYLKEILPQPSAIGTGFIVNEHNLSSKQIDIIIYDPRIAPLFKLDELVVVVPEAVYGIIEVKTTHRKSNYSEELNNANSNGKLVTIPLRKYIAEKENKIFEENRGYLEKNRRLFF